MKDLFSEIAGRLLLFVMFTGLALMALVAPRKSLREAEKSVCKSLSDVR